VLARVKYIYRLKVGSGAPPPPDPPKAGQAGPGRQASGERSALCQHGCHPEGPGAASDLPRTCDKRAVRSMGTGGYGSYAWGQEATHSHGRAKGQLPARQPAEATKGGVNTTGVRAAAGRGVDNKVVRSNDNADRAEEKASGRGDGVDKGAGRTDSRHPQDNEKR